MPYTFSEAQKDVLRNLVEGRDVDDPSVRFDDVYRQIITFIEGEASADVQSVVVFLRGAEQVNAKVGNFSEMIRAYTRRQLELRSSIVLSDQEMEDRTMASCPPYRGSPKKTLRTLYSSSSRRL